MLKCEFWGKKQFIFVNSVIEPYSRPIKVKKENIIRVKFSFKYATLIGECFLRDVGAYFTVTEIIQIKF